MPAKKPKELTAAEIGRKGNKARNENMTPEQRSEAARHAAIERWKQRRAEQKKEKT